MLLTALETSSADPESTSWVRDDIDLAARSDVRVLITGRARGATESTARAIHQASRRRRGPFVAVQCCGLTETQFWAAIQAAHAGTLFLDGIEDTTPDAQVFILRFLESSTVSRGEVRDYEIANVRIITAAYHDLLKRVSAGEFHGGLLYRLNQIHIVFRVFSIASTWRHISAVAGSMVGQRMFGWFAYVDQRFHHVFLIQPRDESGAVIPCASAMRFSRRRQRNKMDEPPKQAVRL